MKSNIQNKKINDETITVSRTDYEELQHQVAQLKAHLDVDGDDKDTVTILSSEYEQMQQHLDQLEKQVDWLTEQLVTMNKQKFGAKSESMNNEIVEQLSLLPQRNDSVLKLTGSTVPTGIMSKNIPICKIV